MKLRHAIIITFLLGLFAFNVHSEQYKAPELQLNSNHSQQDYTVAKEKDFKNLNENVYRVQEATYSDRNLASEQEPDLADTMDGRNPSSQGKERGPVQQEDSKSSTQAWHYNKN